jgi:hypothetical protein
MAERVSDADTAKMVSLSFESSESDPSAAENAVSPDIGAVVNGGHTDGRKAGDDGPLNCESERLEATAISQNVVSLEMEGKCALNRPDTALNDLGISFSSPELPTFSEWLLALKLSSSTPAESGHQSDTAAGGRGPQRTPAEAREVNFAVAEVAIGECGEIAAVDTKPLTVSTPKTAHHLEDQPKTNEFDAVVGVAVRKRSDLIDFEDTEQTARKSGRGCLAFPGAQRIPVDGLLTQEHPRSDGNACQVLRSPKCTDRESLHDCSATFEIDRPELSFSMPTGSPLRPLVGHDSAEPASDEREDQNDD